MPVFVGWVPTITGRLSFSRIGDGAESGSYVCNLTRGPTNFLFGVQRRTSRDGPLPAFITHRMGRFPRTQYLIFLRVTEGELPYPKTHCADATDSEADIVLRTDDRGQLAGEVFFINGYERVCTQFVAEALDQVRAEASKAAIEGAKVQLDAAAADGCFQRAQDAAEGLWRNLVATARADKLVPNFGRARIRLFRTGECQVEVADEDLFTTELIQLAQIKGADGEAWQAAAGDFAAERASVAEQCFFALRDLAHKHYHHESEADLLTTAYEQLPGEDEHWRRETQYGLVRMSIAVRREDRAESYRRALGIIAYAEAFQRHICGWTLDEKGRVRPSRLRFDYDFSALRASIDSSLKARELADMSRRTRLLFSFGLMITAITMILPTLRAAEPESLNWSGASFRWLIDLASAYPWFTLIVAAGFGWLVDISTLRIAGQPQFLESFAASLTRYANGKMADARRSRSAAASKRSAALAILTFIVVTSTATVLLVGVGMFVLKQILQMLGAAAG